MAVFVGQLYNWHTSPAFPWSSACHLFADDVGELHGFAAKIGLKRSWFHKNTSLPHYDLTRGKRRQALKAGAVEADRKTEVKYICKFRTRKPDRRTG